MTATQTDNLVDQWERDGFVIVRGLFSEDTVTPLIDAASEICRTADDGAIAVPEGHVWTGASSPEHQIAKVFRIHDRDPFRRIALAPEVLDLLAVLIGPDIDLFLSQFIFKWPEAYGQPWHQDSFYFSYEPDHQVGVWVAANAATVANGCLNVVPGTHREPVHTHVPDERPNVTMGYYEITDHDMSTAVAVEMEAGDVLFFDSHVMHASTDNETEDLRAAYVCHYTPIDTEILNHDRELVTDWYPALRDGVPVR